ncbi:hypothetical protein LNKW23_41860 [Paralimibaculum aggregatum]|uniref:TIGR03750 family conjugal transfer protein n=1 Tax=Paralimibaculum aggregatum TaxID=3036245 RepID=A0ABQ6LSC3_9RHOB|nr:hypothetical protein [Limibaculum sp. NKW23]GMG84970.1 hypothetical protein LNKW23_41860 [Limibaculum sp. NKW23]
MIFGSISIDDGAVNTHRDSYILDSLTVVSVRRPLLAPAAVIGGGFTAFSWANADLLYPTEIGTLVGASMVALVAGLWLGQLKLLSRDLRGSELSGAIWGSYRRLNHKRAEIVAKRRRLGGRPFA